MEIPLGDFDFDYIDFEDNTHINSTRFSFIILMYIL